MTDENSELQKIDAAIQAQEALRGIVPEDKLEITLAALRQQRQATLAKLEGSGAIAQGPDAKAIGEKGVMVGGNMQGDIVTGFKVELAPPGSKPLPLDKALQWYLDNLIATHQHLRLQGIRAGSQPLSVALEKVYVSLTAMDKRVPQSMQQNKKRRDTEDAIYEPGYLTIASALQRYRRLVIIGDPGCGKTTLLAYLTLTYARALRDGVDTVIKRLQLNESDHLPILLPLRDLGHHLKEKHPNPGKDGPALLLDYLREYYLAQEIHLPQDFFSTYLESGNAVILLDGMDEVADPALRQRVARLIEKFVLRYPKCRFVVTSREVGYEGSARIGVEFGLAKVREFNPSEVRKFVYDWTLVVETTLAGSEAPEILRLAKEQAQNLVGAIETNPRVADLAVNPLLLTVIALVHRYRAQLPERRSELYEEAIEVLLGHWDEAKGLQSDVEIAGFKMDSGDRRSLLEPVAFWMHERQQREIERDDLRPLLLPTFKTMTDSDSHADKALDDFLHVINERSGLLIERGIGIYGFAHLTFQEYLAARALADRADALEFSLKKLPDPWWREVILLQAGYLSTQGKRRVSELIQAVLMADPKTELEPHHHLLLAAECLFDVGAARVEGDLLGEARQRLQKQADAPIKKGERESVLQKVTAMNALARIESGQIAAAYWKQPWGEPEWITIPAGKFWMGDDDSQYEDERPAHQVHIAKYQIGRVPITNAQYEIFVKDTSVNPPEHWRGGQVPKGLEAHPVVNVSWNDALDYCSWLSEKTGRAITLPSEAEWEKAARGDMDKRDYPWGKRKELHCNSSELGLVKTTPVGLFLNGVSPYGLLDMSGNVWEWTRTIWDKDKFKYPYQVDDGRENRDREDKAPRVLRGGAFYFDENFARCAYRYFWNPDLRFSLFGFRVVVSPVLPSS